MLLWRSNKTTYMGIGPNNSTLHIVIYSHSVSLFLYQTREPSCWEGFLGWLGPLAMWLRSEGRPLDHPLSLPRGSSPAGTDTSTIPGESVLSHLLPQPPSRPGQANTISCCDYNNGPWNGLPYSDSAPKSTTLHTAVSHLLKKTKWKVWYSLTLPPKNI